MRGGGGGGEEEDEEEEDIILGLGTRTGSTLLFSTTARFCNMKQTTILLTFVISFD